MNKTQLTKVIPRAVTKISRCRVDTTIRRGIAREEAEEIPGPPPPPPRLLIASLSNEDGDGDGDGNGNDKKAIG